MSDPFALEAMEPFMDRTILRNGSLVLASSVFLRHRKWWSCMVGISVFTQHGELIGHDFSPSVLTAPF